MNIGSQFVVTGIDVVIPNAPLFGVSSRTSTQLCPPPTRAISGGFSGNATIDQSFPEQDVDRRPIGWTVRANNTDSFASRTLVVFVVCQLLQFSF